LSELAVVCANCHMLIHMNPKRALDIQELRNMLRKSPKD
jgi:predicted HNH restriction endonuclease